MIACAEVPTPEPSLRAVSRPSPEEAGKSSIVRVPLLFRGGVRGAESGESGAC